MQDHWLNKYGLLIFDKVDSTSLEAERLINHGVREELIILAKIQENGKGRSGHHWHSPEGNLYFTLIKETKITLGEMQQFTFIASLAMHEAIQGVIEDDPDLKLKWPNDILLRGKKISGILLEVTKASSQETSSWLRIGIGVNLECSPKGLKYPVTSLKEEGYPVIAPEILLDRFMRCFLYNISLWQMSGFKIIKNLWLKHAFNLGEEMRCSAKNEIISGVFIGLNDDGALLLKRNDDSIDKITAGEVFHS